MGKKKDKKGKGKEKTTQKTEKKAEKRAKKELVEKGEEDIEKLIAEFQERDKKLTQVTEEKCGPPAPRCNMSLTAHPDKDELIMFGGEHFTGNKMYVYNDLYIYNIKKNEWFKVTAPPSPPPRCAHQAVALKQGGGQLWIFGGEFANPTQTQFYHYKDLWVYHLKEKRWEKVEAKGGPTARSGHRMVQCKKQLIVFGGFHDNIRDYKYYNDTYAFNLETYTWSKLEPSGIPPAPRSGCVMAAEQDQYRVVIYGGYSKEKLKKDVDQGKTHTDMFALVPEGRVKGDTVPEKWKWMAVKQSGVRPTPRSGLSLAVVPGNRAICFGGVFDEEENEEKLRGKFYNEMFSLELDRGKWFDVVLRGKNTKERKKRRRKKETKEDGEDEGSDDEDELSDEEMDTAEDDIKKLKLDKDMDDNCEQMEQNGFDAGEVTPAGVIPETREATLTATDSAMSITEGNEQQVEHSDGVFKVTIGPQSSGAGPQASASGSEMDTDIFVPHPRMNGLLAVKNGILYMYGGIYEVGDKQFTLSDFYSIDLHKLEEWNVIIENQLNLEALKEESDSSSDGEDGARGGDDDDDDESDEEMEIDFSDAPALETSEDMKQYFERTKLYWIEKSRTYCQAEGIELSNKKLEKFAREMCQENWDDR